MNNRYKSYKFWLAILGGVLIIVQNIFKVNGIVITDEVGYNIINAVCGVLVFLGVIDKPKENGNGENDKDLSEKNIKNNDDSANKNNTEKNKIVEKNENIEGNDNNN